MARKPHKIKRYKSISKSDSYGRTVRRKVILGALAAFLLFLLGWMLYQPVYDFLTGGLAEQLEKRPPASSGASSDAPDPAESQPEEPPLPAEPEPEAGFRALYLPVSLLHTSTLEPLLSTMKAAGLDAALIELKGTDGRLIYQSAVPDAVSIGAVSEQPVDLSALLAMLKAQGIRPIARIHAFRDPLAGGRIADAGVKYQQTQMLWLDNSKENGGKPWLNPYSSQAQNYVTALALEAANLGFEHIILDSFHFPVGYGLHLAGYGEAAGSTAKNAVLRQYADALRTTLAAKNTGLSVYTPATSAMGINEERFGGSPLTLSGESVALGVMPGLFGAKFEAQGLSLTAPVQSPYDTVRAVLTRVMQNARDVEIIPFLQSYTDRSIAYEVNKNYTWLDVKEQIRAVEELGIHSYVVYDPAGGYVFE